LVRFRSIENKIIEIDKLDNFIPNLTLFNLKWSSLSVLIFYDFDRMYPYRYVLRVKLTKIEVE